jgi:hypothetical protein
MLRPDHFFLGSLRSSHDCEEDVTWRNVHSHQVCYGM